MLRCVDGNNNAASSRIDCHRHFLPAYLVRAWRYGVRGHRQRRNPLVLLDGIVDLLRALDLDRLLVLIDILDEPNPAILLGVAFLLDNEILQVNGIPARAHVGGLASLAGLALVLQGAIYKFGSPQIPTRTSDKLLRRHGWQKTHMHDLAS